MQKDATLTWKEVKNNYNAEYRAAVDDLPKDLSKKEKKAKLQAWLHRFSYGLAKSGNTGTEDVALDDD
jgi:hypothetical protein